MRWGERMEKNTFQNLSEEKTNIENKTYTGRRHDLNVLFYLFNMA